MEETKNKIILAIKKAAEARGVDFEFIKRTYYYLSLGDKKVMFSESLPETTTALSYRIIENKFLANFFLSSWGFPVQAMTYYVDKKNAIEFLKENKKVVIKPEQGMHGKGITVGITDEDELGDAVDLAMENDPHKKVLLEQYREGFDYRILVVGRKKIFASRKEPVFVIGDGKNDIVELLAQRNSKLIERYRQEKDNLMERFLEKQTLTFETILEVGQKIYLRGTANIKSGGTPVDCTEKVSEKIKQTVLEISKKLKVDVAGFDIMTENISGDNFSIIEINSFPGILLHIYPVTGESYDVADEIVKCLFFPEEF